MKLAAKLSLFFILFSVVPIFTVGWLSYRNSRTTIEQQTINHLISTNIYKEAEFERWVRDNVRTLEILANRPFLKKDLAGKLEAYDASNPTQTAELTGIVADYLLPVVKGSGFFEVFILEAGSGRLLISTDKRQVGKYLDDQSFFKNGRNRTFIQNVYYAMTLQQPAMTISTPIMDSLGKTAAVLAGRLDLSELSGIVGKRSDLSRSEDTYLVNKFNFFITEPRFGRDYALKKSVQTEGVRAALAGKDGVGFYADYRSVPVIGAYHWMPDWDLALITEIDQAEAFAPISALQKTIGGVGIAVALLAALLGAVIARTITRPVSRLVEGTEEISCGNLGYNVGTSGSDEIGELSERLTG